MECLSSSDDELSHSIVSARSELVGRSVIRYSADKLRALKKNREKKPNGYFCGFNLAKQSRRFDERTKWGRAISTTEFFVHRRQKSRHRCGERRERRVRNWNSLHPPHGRNFYCKEEERQANAQLLKSTSREVVVLFGNNCGKQHKRRKARKQKKLVLACFNARTLSITTSETRMMHNEKADRLPHLIIELHTSGTELCCVSEVRRCGTGSESRDGYVLFWSGTAAEKIHGVGIILTQKLARGIDKVLNISARLMAIQGEFNGMKMTIISVYAPTELYSLVEKTRFYDSLDQLVLGLPAEYTQHIIILGDFNARIGPTEEAWKHVRGRFAGGPRQNENGLMLLEFCSRHRLLIGNTLFRKKKYGTWRHPRSKRFQTLDWCLIGSRSRYLLKDCGVDDMLECFSDHKPVKMVLKVDEPRNQLGRIIQGQRQKKPPKPDYASLVRNVEPRFALGRAIDVGLAAAGFNAQTENVSCRIAEFNAVVKEAVAATVPDKPRARKHADWFDASRLDIQQLVIERRRLRAVMLENRCTENVTKYLRHKAVTQRALRQMQSEFYTKRSERIQWLADQHEDRAYYEAVKEFFGSKKMEPPKELLAKDTTTVLKAPEDLKKRWREHFQELLNQPGEAAEDIDGLLRHTKQAEPILELDRNWEVVEFLRALNAAKHQKSAGPDQKPIEVETFAESEQHLNILWNFCQEVLQFGEVPSDMKDVIIAILFKKGDKRDCGNYRGLSLIAHMGKVLERMVQNRLQPVAEERGWFPEEQNGFRPGRSTVDAIFVSRMISSSCRELGLPCFKCFVDLTKAYDKVNREILWKLLAKLGVPPKLLKVIIALHEGAQAWVRVNGELLEPFQLESGLKQGSIFAPLLFNIFFGAIIFEIDRRLEGKGIRLRFRVGSKIFSLSQLRAKNLVSMTIIWKCLFADDAAVFAESEAELQHIMRVFDAVCAEFGQEVSFKKTEVLITKPRHGAIAPKPSVNMREGDVDQAGNPLCLKVVNEFKYLGALEDDVCGMDKELNTRRQKTAAALSMHSKAVFENKRIRLRTKVLMYLTTGQTTLLYGCACWVTTQKQFQKLESVQIQHLRRCLGLKWHDRVSYLQMLKQTARYKAEILPVEAVVRERRLLYLGHVERMGASRLPYRVLHGEVVGGKRARGKSERQYRHCVKEDLQKFGISEKDWQQIAADEMKWKAAVATGLKIFLRSWREHRIAERQKAKAAERRRRRPTTAEDAPTPSRVSARPPLEHTIRALDERQDKIPAILQTIQLRNPPSIVARMLACANDHLSVF
jgi:hypothetical protein